MTEADETRLRARLRRGKQASPSSPLPLNKRAGVKLQENVPSFVDASAARSSGSGAHQRAVQTQPATKTSPLTEARGAVRKVCNRAVISVVLIASAPCLLADARRSKVFMDKQSKSAAKRPLREPGERTLRSPARGIIDLFHFKSHFIKAALTCLYLGWLLFGAACAHDDDSSTEHHHHHGNRGGGQNGGSDRPIVSPSATPIPGL